MEISIVSPVYMGEKLTHELVSRLTKVLTTITDDYEIILVEDGSPDKSWKAIQEVCKSNPNVKGIKLSRNFGQHYAITCGLEATSGNWVVVMDCDLQDRPEEIPKLIEKAKEGFDYVLAQRVERKDKFSKRFYSKLFYKIFGYLTETKYDNKVANFGIYNRNVINAVLSLRDKVKVFPILVQWVGYEKASIAVEHQERFEGRSSYNFRKLLKLSTDIIISFSNKPLRLAIGLGFVISTISFAVGLFYVMRYALGYIQFPGFASLMVSIWFFGGLIILLLGILGLYIGKIFDAVKDRPVYLVETKINF